MKKRILSILLCLCMAACMLPTVAFAAGAENDKAIQLGTDALSKNVNTEAAPTVYFGQDHGNNPAAWRVIGYDGSGVAGAQGDMTLLAAGTMGEAAFDSVNYSSEYAPSELKTAIDALEAKLTTEENAAVKKRTLASGSYNGENTDCVAGAQVDNAVFWPLSIAEAHAVNQDLRIVNKEHTNWAMYHWWLRSPCKSSSSAAVVHGNGEVLDDGMYHTSDEFGVRPAFNLNLNAVLFASAAVGGKPNGGLTPISEHTGNEWKLTLLDNSRNFAVTEKTVSGDTITFSYSNAQTGTNEYISVIIKDNGEITHYGRILHLGGTTGGASGTASLTLPAGITLDNDTKLYVFNEQYNGGKKTDYASDFTDIALTVEKQADEQFSLAPGGRYYFDLSAMNIPGTANSNLPDSRLHYVPFTYVGTVNAYKLISETATTDEYAQQNKYPHSLFIADYNVTFNVDWNQLNEKQMIFGTPYTSYGVNYTMRAPSAGSQSNNGTDDSSTRGIPKSNEWDAILDKANQDWKDNTSGYIKNWSGKYSFGQDNYANAYRAYRGYFSARFWGWSSASTRHPDLCFRPVLEVPNSDILGSDGLKAVTLALGGGKLGGSSDAIHIIVKTGSEFTAPASNGLTRPDGNTGSYFMWLDGNGNSYAPGGSVPADVTALTVQWTVPTYTVTLNTNGGTINNGNVTEYTYGVGAALPTDVTRTGYTFKGWYDNEGLTGDPVTAICSTETGNKEYWAKWEINQYTITYDLAGGTAEGNPNTYTIETGAFTLKNPTKSGYTFTGWSGTGLDGENNMTVTIPKGSTGERRYTAHWRYNGGSSGGSSSYPITVPSKTENGTVTVSPKSASAGSTVTITVKPDSGYVLETISVTDKNGNDLKLTDKGGGKYTFTMPASKVEVKATFMEDNSVLNFFYDVPNDAYYYEAIKWAAENGVTGGVGNSLFAPNQPCTRAQIVTFLWRAAGSPVVNYLMPFTDVDEGAYYAEAVRWAASTGIVTGLTETTFGTDSVCTRAQAAAMIYRCAQAQGKGFTGAWMFHLPFTDVPEWAYESVAWCYMNGVTTGVSETAFAPGNDCTRAQIVTFLWRAFSK